MITPERLSLPPSFAEFMTAVMDHTRDELARRDPAYVEIVSKTVQAMPDLGVAYQRVPKPKARLPKAWSETLESMFELVEGLDNLRTALRNFKIAAAEPDELESGRELIYHGYCWNVWALALFEKAEVAIDRVLRRSGLPRAQRVGLGATREERFAMTKEHLEHARNPVVHGGQPGVIHGASAEQIWEPVVALGLTPDLQFPIFYRETAEWGMEWLKDLVVRTDEITALVGAELRETILAVGWHTGSARSNSGAQ